MKNVYRDGERSPALAVKPYLHDGETVLWTGTPYEKASYRPPLLPILFMCFWLCFAVAWTATASAMGGLFGLAGIPFLLIGGAMLWFLTAGIAHRAKYTLYDNKISTGDESAQSKRSLENRMAAIGFQVVTARGDIIRTAPKS